MGLVAPMEPCHGFHGFRVEPPDTPWPENEGPFLWAKVRRHQNDTANEHDKDGKDEKQQQPGWMQIETGLELMYLDLLLSTWIILDMIRAVDEVSCKLRNAALEGGGGEEFQRA